jgi:1-deoxy-D-xylulose-5-phosphate synthase
MPEKILDRINLPEDLRQIEIEKLPQLAKEIRQFIIDVVSTKEGHLGASLGVVELTIALHYVFDTPTDLLVWDVGHQAYGHKIITGRKSQFNTNRQLNGVSGFPKRQESIYDTFGTGHSSTAISAALGMAIASAIKGNFKKNHIAVVGDASIASGMAFEALNHAGVSDANLLIVLNDNDIGIDPSVGALRNHFRDLKSDCNRSSSNLFEHFQLNYSGPIDGHDLNLLIGTLTQLKNIPGPKILHVVTTKGKGLSLAEKHQVTYHAPGKFDKNTGELISTAGTQMPPKFQDVFGLTLVELAKKNPNIVGITPAMPTGCSLNYLMDAFPERTFDVGIAEQHAVTLAAGMATQGLTVYCNIYATFIQRAYDQVIHDVALQNLPVVFCLDRAGLVGEDGATHHGLFDIAFLRCIPNLIIFAPLNEAELRNILYTTQEHLTQPIAIRYPRGRGTTKNWQQPFQKINYGQGKCLSDGEKAAFISTGFIGNAVAEAILKLPVNTIAHYHFGFIKPLDEPLLHEILSRHQTVFTAEDGILKGGFGSAISEFIAFHGYASRHIAIGIQDQFIEHGTVAQLADFCGISADKILKKIQEVI